MFGQPVADAVGPHPFVGWQAAFDPLLTPGARNYWKSHNFMELSDGLLDLLVELVGRLPTPECEIFIGQLGGATGRVDDAATAYPHRAAKYVMNVHTRWQSADDDVRAAAGGLGAFYRRRGAVQHRRRVRELLHRGRGRARVPQSVQAPTTGGCVSIKRRFDPGNLFRTNVNVSPAEALAASERIERRRLSVRRVGLQPRHRDHVRNRPGHDHATRAAFRNEILTSDVPRVSGSAKSSPEIATSR